MVVYNQISIGKTYDHINKILTTPKTLFSNRSIYSTGIGTSNQDVSQIPKGR